MYFQAIFMNMGKWKLTQNKTIKIKKESDRFVKPFFLPDIYTVKKEKENNNI
jgi:hypothetical protein